FQAERSILVRLAIGDYLPRRKCLQRLKSFSSDERKVSAPFKSWIPQIWALKQANKRLTEFQRLIFMMSKSIATRLLDLICTRQGSNLQPYDPKSEEAPGRKPAP